MFLRDFHLMFSSELLRNPLCNRLDFDSEVKSFLSEFINREHMEGV